MQSTTKLFFLLLLINVSIFWVIEYPPLQDYPLYLERIFVLHNLNNPSFNFAQYYEINYSITTNIANEFMGLILIQLLPIEIVGKMLITITLGVFCFGLFKFFDFFYKNNIISLASIFFVHNILFFYGFLNFTLATGIFFLAITELFKTGFGNKIKLMALLLAIYLSHLFVFLVFVPIFLIFLIEKKAHISNLLIFVPSALLLAYYSFFGLLTDSKNLFGFIQNPIIVKILEVGSMFIVFSKFNILPAISMIIIFAYFIFIKIKNKTDLIPNQKITAKILALIVLIFLLLPRQTYNWGLVDLRITIFIPVFLFVLGNYEKANKKILVFLVSLLIVSTLASNFFFMNQASGTINTLLEARTQIKENSKVLVLFSECPHCFTTTPLIHYSKFFTIFNGSIVPQTFTESKFLLVNRKSNISLPSPSEFNQFSFSVEKHGKYYDYILLYKSNERIVEDITNNGFKLKFENENIQLFEKE